MIIPGLHLLEVQPFSLLHVSEFLSQEKCLGLLLTFHIQMSSYILTTLGKYSQSLTQSVTYVFPIILIKMINSNVIPVLSTTWEFHDYMKFYISDL